MKLQQWQKDKQWADKYYPAIVETVKTVASKIIKVEIAPELEDNLQATDYIVTVEAGKIACRIRRPNCTYRDFTIRAWRSTGAKTELAKIKEGFARWYLYAWANNDFSFLSWVLIDLDKFRASPLLLSQRALQYNPDGCTGFISFKLPELYLWDCIIFQK